MDLKIGGFYNWKYQRERLIYVSRVTATIAFTLLIYLHLLATMLRAL